MKITICELRILKDAIDRYLNAVGVEGSHGRVAERLSHQSLRECFGIEIVDTVRPRNDGRRI